MIMRHKGESEELRGEYSSRILGEGERKSDTPQERVGTAYDQ